MVRGAPVFAEVADSFMRFMDEGIFVAHNVNFDYGFLSHEYERLDRRFRFPKLCTVAGMRRRYPGHKSYGLGKLCDLYGIELETHHRALCDARATGQPAESHEPRAGRLRARSRRGSGLIDVLAEANSFGDGAGVRVRKPHRVKFGANRFPNSYSACSIC